jgi:hypothetical protein
MLVGLRTSIINIPSIYLHSPVELIIRPPGRWFARSLTRSIIRLSARTSACLSARQFASTSYCRSFVICLRIH